MPGFDKSRVVNLTVQQLDEFTCSICLAIFINPMVTQCCRQTYCKDCITEWVSEHETCPNDRTILTVEDLSPVPKVIINLLDNMKIKCDYESDGCSQVLKMEDLSKHLEVCDYRPNQLCKTCGLMREFVSTHNCVQSLITEKEKIEQAHLELLNEYCELSSERQENEQIISTLRNDLAGLKNSPQNLEYQSLMPEIYLMPEHNKSDLNSSQGMCESLEIRDEELDKLYKNKKKVFVVIAIVFSVFIIANIAGAYIVYDVHDNKVSWYKSNYQILKVENQNLTEDIKEMNTNILRLKSELDQMKTSNKELTKIKIDNEQTISSLSNQLSQSRRNYNRVLEEQNRSHKSGQNNNRQRYYTNFADKLSNYNLSQLLILFLGLMIIQI